MTRAIKIQDFELWDTLENLTIPISFELELTARCNNNCRHCYINVPANCQVSRQKEMSVYELKEIIDQVTDMGTIWCLLTGGEPMIRKDFPEVYLMLRSKGLLITLFTNACLITNESIKLFKENPPRDIEVTVYGITEGTYESVTRVPGSYKAFRKGLDLLLDSGLNVSLKAVPIRSNFQEFNEIAKFCRKYSSRPFRFDPFLHLRYDRNSYRNAEILSERLSSEEIIELEKNDRDRIESMKKNCERLIFPNTLTYDDFLANEDQQNSEQFESWSKLFRCGIGKNDYSISFDGQLSLCSTLRAPEFMYDLKTGNLKEGFSLLRNRVFSTKTKSIELLKTCKSCPIVNLCLWCPAVAYLETGDLEGRVDYFCEVAHARKRALINNLHTD